MPPFDSRVSLARPWFFLVLRSDRPTRVLGYFQGEHLFVPEGGCRGIARVASHSLPPRPEKKGEILRTGDSRGVANKRSFGVRSLIRP